MMKDADAFWQWVQQRMEDRGILSFRELERKAGVSTGLISSRKNDLKFPTVQMAEGLCEALQVSWVDLWEQAGFVQRLNADQLTGIDAEIHEALQDASDDFKRAVLKTIRTWLVVSKNKN
jgi:transcriptional regulator with XRE-family HTH domain